MTTNVFDGIDGTLATDSRWSIQYGRWLLYIDDTGFDKLEIVKNYAFMFAGRGQLIQEWKNWLRSNPKDASDRPAVEGICLSGINLETKIVSYSEGKSITHENSIFAGSGASYAIVCWTKNKDAVRSVETAKSLDPATGGTVKYIEFSTGKNNLAITNLFAPNTIQQVDKELLNRGIYMDITTRKLGSPPFQLSQIAASNASSSEMEFQELQQKLASGELSANAPCDAMYSEWTPESKAQLNLFLGEVFGWSN